MPLIDIWRAKPEIVTGMTLQQIVGMAGDGKLSDGSDASREIRSYFSEIPSEQLFHYVDELLSDKFLHSGYVLQDLVNELGRRLEYDVENGRYQGTTRDIGFDGIWKSPDGHCIVIEVKTTDVFSINLNTVSQYRQDLIDEGYIPKESSILIVVGREDTGSLEAQIRGSRQAWDTRLISVDFLVKLVRLKENTNEEDTINKIRSVLIPFEFTRLDNIIDTMFSAATDIDEEPEVIEMGEGGEEEKGVSPEKGKIRQHHTDRELIDEVRKRIITALGKREGKPLISRSRALFWSSDRALRACCTISKRHSSGKGIAYWYAYHPKWDTFLEGGSTAYFVLGCVDIELAFAIPHHIVYAHLDELSITERAAQGTMYWHIYIAEPTKGIFELRLPKLGEVLPLKDFELGIE